ncbi:MAG: hypothetical protein GY754_08630, partial [bacterium]|nr:hypothetical protein [bacterium]
MKKKFLCFTVFVLLCFSLANCNTENMNNRTVRSPLIPDDGPVGVLDKGILQKGSRSYMKIDGELFRELKQGVKNKEVKAITGFPLYGDKPVTIEDIEEVETFAEKTAIYHGSKRIFRKPDIVAIKGKIAENGGSIFLTLSPRGAYGFFKDANGKPERNIKYSPNSVYSMSSDAGEEDIQDLNLMNDIIENEAGRDTVSAVSNKSLTAARGLSQMGYYRIAIDTTENFLNKFDGDTEAAEDYIFALFAYVNPAFNDFNAHLYVNYIRLWPNGNDGYYSTGLRSLLSEFGYRWRNPANPEYSIPRHASVILSLFRDGSAVGWGGIDVVCNKTGSASAYQGYSSLYMNAMIVAHELGHVFGSGHTWDYDPPIEECTIMSYCNTEDNFVFHPRVIELFNSLRSWENDSCVPLTNPELDSCSAPEVSVTGTLVDSISIVWNDARADSYTVSYMPSGASNWTIAASGLTTYNYVLSDLPGSTTYTIRVQSICSDGSELSTTVTAATGTCTAPTVTVTDTFIDYLTISWDDEGVNNYNILYKEEGASSWTTAVTGFTGKTYQLSGLTDETTYNIRVYSICPEGQQLYTEVTETTDEIKNCIVPVVSVTGTSTTTISISWNDAGADTYSVYSRESGASDWVAKAINIKLTAFEVRYLEKSTTYDIRVISNCQDGSTISSSIISETTDELVNGCSASEPRIAYTTASSIALAWDDTGTVSPDNYDVLYTIATHNNYVTAATGLTAKSYTLNGLIKNTTYSILLRSNCSGGTQLQDYVYGRTDEAQGSCSVPTINVSGTSESSISLSWNNTDADSYTVSYRAYGSSSWTTAVTGLTGTSYVISGLADNTTYSIRVYSVCSDGSQSSSTITATTGETQVSCTAPEANVSGTSESSISLSWSNTGAADYTVEYKVSSASTWQTAAAGLSTTGYTLSGLTANTTYNINIYSNCSDGSKPYDTVTATTDEAQVSCTAPEVTVTGTSENSISLSWDDEGANSYSVYYKTGSGSWTNAASGLTTTSYVITGLAENTTYDIVVQSFCPDGTSPYTITAATTDDPGGTGLTINDIPGQYVREPAANGWHTGTISLAGDSLQWENEAGASWTLIPDLENGQLLTTDDCAYPGENFTLVLNQNGDGTVELTGFVFLNETYILQEEEAGDMSASWLFNYDLLDSSGDNDLTSGNNPVFSTDSAEGSYSVEFNGVDDYLYTNSGQSF